MKKSNDDIREVGLDPIMGVRNSDLYNKAALAYANNPSASFLFDFKSILNNNEELKKKIIRNNLIHDYKIKEASSGFLGYELFDDPAFYLPLVINTGIADWGESMFDEGIVNSLETLQDARAYNQPWYAKIAAGIGKGGVMAATTAAGLLGTLYGIGLGIYNLADGDNKTGFWLGLWDNPINLALNAINEKAEEWMPNYYSEYEMSHPFVFNANFIGDKIIKNFGFMVGAFYGGIPVSKALGWIGKSMVMSKRAKLLKEATDAVRKGIETAEVSKKYKAGLDAIHRTIRATRGTTQLLGSIASAANEGAIEAVSNSTEFAKVELEKENVLHQSNMLALLQLYADNPEELEKQMQLENQRYNNRLEAIETERIKMGNADFLLNLPILTFSNLVMYGKQYLRGFAKDIKEYKLLGDIGNLKSGKTWYKGLGRGLKDSLSEGLEEYLQSAASEGPKNIARLSLENYIDASKDYDSSWGVGDAIFSFAKAVAEQVKDPQALEEFTIGAISASIGMPTFGSNTRNAWTGDNGKFGLSGGLIGGMKDYYSEKKAENRVATYINERVKDPKFKAMYLNMVAHHRFEKLKEEALALGDKKKYEDAEWDLFVHDINMFSIAGKLDEYKEMINFSQEYTNEEIDSIVENTTKTITATELQEADTARLTSLKAERDRMSTLLKNLRKELSSVPAASKVADATLDNIIGIEDALIFLDNEINTLTKRLEEGYKDIVTGPFRNNSGEVESYDNIRLILSDNRKLLLESIDDIIKIRDGVNAETDGRLSNDDIGTLTYLKAKIMNTEARAIRSKEALNPTLRGLRKALEAPREITEESIAELELKEKLSDKEKERLEKLKKTLLRIKTELNTLEKLLNADHEEFLAYMRSDAVVAMLSKLFSRGSLFKHNKIDSKIKYGHIVEDILTDLPLDEWHDYTKSEHNEKKTYSIDYYTELNSYESRGRAFEEMAILRALSLEKGLYQQMLSDFLKDPSKLNKALTDSDARLTSKLIDKQSDALANKLKNATSLRDIADVITDSNSDPRIVAEALRKAKEQGNEDLVKSIEEVERLQRLKDDLNKLLTEEENVPPEVVASIIASLDAEFDNVLDDTSSENKSEALVDSLTSLAKDFETAGRSDISKVLKNVIKNYKENKSRNSVKPKSKIEEKKEEETKGKGKNSTGKVNTSTKLSKTSITDDIVRYLNSIDSNQELLTFIQNVINGSEPLPKRIHESIEAWNKDHTDDLIDAKFINDVLLKYIEDAFNDENGDISTAYDKDSDEDSTEALNKASEMSQHQNTSFVSYGVTKYKIVSKSKDDVTLISAEEYEAEGLAKTLQDALKALGVYDFLDNGFLGAINLEEGSNIPIYYLRSNKIPGVENAVFLAIKWDSSYEDTIKRYCGPKADIDSIKKIELTVNGKTETFVIVGNLSITKLADEQIKESFNNLNKLLNDEFDELQKDETLSNEDFVVSTKYLNELDTINTGRLDQSFLQQSLYDWVMGTSEWNEGDSPLLYFKVVIDNQVEGINNLENAVSPNQEWLKEHSGAVLVYVRKPDGKLYPVRCSRKSVKDWLDNAHSATTGTEMLEESIKVVVDNEYSATANEHINLIVECIKSLVDPNSSFGDKVKAKIELGKLFIMGKVSPILISENGDVTIFAEVIDTDDVKDAILQVFKVLVNNNVLFTIPLESWNLRGNTAAIVTSGILNINLNGFHNFNSNFTIRPTDSEGKPIKKKVTPQLDYTKPPIGRTEKATIDGKKYKVTYTADGSGIEKLVDAEDETKEYTPDTDEFKLALFALQCLRGNARSVADVEELDGEEFSYFRAVYENEELGVIYDRNLPVEKRLIKEGTPEYDEIVDKKNKALVERTKVLAKLKLKLQDEEREKQEGKPQKDEENPAPNDDEGKDGTQDNLDSLDDSTTNGRQSTWFENVKRDDKGNVRLATIGVDDPIKRKIFEHMQLGLKTRFANQVANDLALMEEEGAINLDDLREVDRIVAIISKGKEAKDDMKIEWEEFLKNHRCK